MTVTCSIAITRISFEFLSDPPTTRCDVWFVSDAPEVLGDHRRRDFSSAAVTAADVLSTHVPGFLSWE